MNSCQFNLHSCDDHSCAVVEECGKPATRSFVISDSSLTTVKHEEQWLCEEHADDRERFYSAPIKEKQK